MTSEHVVDDTPRRLSEPDVDDHLAHALELADDGRLRFLIRTARQRKVIVESLGGRHE